MRIWGPSGGHLGTSPGGSILRLFWTHSGPFLDPILRNLIKPLKDLHLAVGRAYLRERLNMGPRDGTGWVPGIAPPGHPSPPLPRVHLPPARYTVCMKRVLYPEYNMVVGLKSVEQLTLSVQFSDIRPMTEVYNLVKIGNR